VLSTEQWAALRRHRTLVAVTILQGVCAVAFLIDLASELHLLWTNPFHPIAEALTVVALWIGTLLGFREIRRLLSRNDEMETRLKGLGNAFHDMLDQTFDRWGLTASERDVALFMVKGMSITEIAALRRTQAGTVKAQCAAIYRKAGVSGRAQMLSFIVDDLTSGVPLSTQAEPVAPLPQLATRH
jgi:DNA-binding CsgD family transcriptional regulator